MKNLIIIVLLAITSLRANAQPPTQRPLPNQFRDFVDHQQRWEKPNIVHKDGKVTIIMSEQQFRVMQQRRRHMMMNRRPGLRHPMSPTCSCEKRFGNPNK